MSLDTSYVGRTYPPTEPYEVGREKIRQFAEAIGDPSPIYRDPAAAVAAGHPDVIAPPTFAVVLSMRAAAQVEFDPGLGLDYRKVLHGEQRFVYDRPVRAGDRLQVVVTVEDVTVKGGNDFLTTRGDITTIEGEHVCTAYSTLIAVGTAGATTREA